MLLYAAAIFASALLLFLVQPVIAKLILPWFGGSAAVWTTCLVFFQTTLLIGYAYSDFTVRRMRPSRQVALHVMLLVASLAVLPILPAAHWRPAGDENPSWRILGLLTATIGLPYLLLSATSPLIQAWFVRTRPGRSPYRLFALSNLASMIALLAYPFALEPWLPTRTQASLWSIAYVVFVLLCGAAAWASLRNAAPRCMPERPLAPPQSDDDDHPGPARQGLWAVLPAMAAILLLAVTNHITQNIAAVPLLWILPLAIYLLTFILTFDRSGWYRRRLFLALLAGAIGAMAWMLADRNLAYALGVQIAVFCSGLFIACMFCHGELVRLKPGAAHLTRFYLMIATGGAVGSVLVGIVAPVLLPAYFELAGGLVLCALLLFWQVRADPWPWRALSAVAVLLAAGAGVWSVQQFYADTIATTRSFYGVLRVLQTGSNDITAHRSLIHGTILHGTQYLAPDLRRRPTTYYTQTSGIGRLLETLHPSITPLRIGVVGLGTGTLAAYGSTGDVYRFYDINPDVPRIARRYFTYLADSEATIQIALGDARLTLEREAPQRFDVLAIDAFSSDAIPVHLLTAEALGVYLRHLKPGGVVAFHVTNRYLNLIPVVEGLAHARGLHVLYIDDPGNGALASRSDWVLVSANGKLLDRPLLAGAATPIAPRRDWRVWTDDFNNLLQVLR